MITPAQRAEIRRLYYGEHWKLGIIATQLGLHPETVRAAVERETAGVRPRVCRPSILDPYLPVIRDTLTQYPRLRATRIHEMLRQRGYAGSVFPVRKLVRHLRPETSRAVYRRVVTLPVIRPFERHCAVFSPRRRNWPQLYPPPKNRAAGPERDGPLRPTRPGHHGAPG